MKQLLHKRLIKGLGKLISALWYDKVGSFVSLAAVFGACSITAWIQCCDCCGDKEALSLITVSSRWRT